MGLLRLGFISSFISHAVTSGLASGASIIIASSQLKYILGITCPRADEIVGIMSCLVENIDQFNWKEFVIGASLIVFLVALRKFGEKNPKYKYYTYLGPFFATVVCISLSAIFGFASHGIKIVHAIPAGLPKITVAWWHPLDLRIMKTVILGVIVGFMESISIARQLAAKNDYTLDTSRELMGLGAANLLGSIFQAYPTTGSFSRSAIKQSVGTKSILSGLFVALFVGIVMVWLTPVFEYMPLATFAAIIINAALYLFDYAGAIRLWKIDKIDFFTWMTCFFVTLFVGIEWGVGVSMGLSLLFVLYETAYPHTATLGRLKQSSVYRNVKQYPDAEEYDGILVVRIDAPMYFANSEYSREKISKYQETRALKSSIPIQFIIIDLSPVSYVDSSGVECLEEILVTNKPKGITLMLCNPNRPVLDKLVLSGVVDRVGHENFFVGVHDAVNTCLKRLGDIEGGTIVSRTSSNEETAHDGKEN
jgi:sulfate transporter 4